MFTCNRLNVNLDSILQNRDITLPTKVCLVKVMIFPVVMYGCENWTIKKTAPKNWCFWTVVLKKTLESPLDCKEIKPVHPKGNQSWIFIGRTNAEAETNTLAMWCEELLGKDPDAGKDWRQEESEMTEVEMVGWHHQFNGHEFEQALGVGDGQGSLVCCSPWGLKEADTTERLNWTEGSSVYVEITFDSASAGPHFSHLCVRWPASQNLITTCKHTDWHCAP